MRKLVLPSLPILACLMLLICCGPRAVRFPTPMDQSTDLRSDDYESLLARYVNVQGDVDYARWQKSEQDVAALDQYLGRMAAAPPSLRPELFTSPHDQLSYWINLYNALVVREVVRRWPLASVRDYRPTLTSKIDTTKGFFRDLRFVIGGKEMSLDDIEHATIRSQFDDARVHFALNCGSTSCPVLRTKPYSGDELERELQSATVAFLNAAENVSVDTKQKRIRLSKIFKWYGSDFEKHARRVTQNPKAGVLDFVGLFAKPELRASLQSARSGKFKIHYVDYDWAVNKGAADSHQGPAAKALSKKPAGPTRRDYPPASAIASLAFTLLSGDTFERAEGKAIVVSMWATYCAPCRKSLPHLQAIAAQHQDALQVLALSADDSQAKIEDFIKSRNIDLPIAFGEEVNALMSQLKVQSLPTEFFIDAQGNIRFSFVGAATNEQLDQAVTELLQAP